MPTTTLWVIAKTAPGPSGKPYTSYWTDLEQVIGGFAFISPWAPSLGPPSGLTGAIRTFPTKQEAKTAYRDAFGKFPRDLDAIALTPEQAAILSGSGRHHRHRDRCAGGHTGRDSSGHRDRCDR